MTVLGVDYGRRRIGLAITDALEMIASPLKTIPNDSRCIPELREIVGGKAVDTVVVGLPLRMDGTLGPAGQEVLQFAERLRKEIPAPVETFDERLTTRQAERAMLAHDLTRARRAARIDQMAAQIMLQGYLDSRKSRRRIEGEARE